MKLIRSVNSKVFEVPRGPGTKFRDRILMGEIGGVSGLLRELLKPIALQPQLISHGTGTKRGVSPGLRFPDVPQPLVSQLRIDPILSGRHKIWQRGYTAWTNPIV